MSQFMFVFRGGGYATPGSLSPSELQAHLAKWNAWTEGLIAAGHLVVAHPLTHPPTGQVLRGRERAVTDGPYAESKDLISGTVIVQARSLEEAASWARDCPILDMDGSVEVRPVLTPS